MNGLQQQAQQAEHLKALANAQNNLPNGSINEQQLRSPDEQQLTDASLSNDTENEEK